MSWTIERAGDVAVVTMTGGGKVNVQSEAFVAACHEALDTLERDHPGRAVVLTSPASAFCAGLDFESVWALFASGDAAAVTAFMDRYRAMNLRLWSYPAPTVAAINGAAFAGGLILALACDYRVCAPAARLCLNEVPIGIPMPASYVELIRYATGRDGPAVTLFGTELSAAEALRTGFVHAVAGDAGAVVRDALAIAQSIAPDCLGAYAYTKRALQAPTRARLDGPARALDAELVDVVMAPEARRARARRYEQIKGRPPAWA